VRVSLDQSGRATVAIGTPSQGQGIETTIAQVVAEELGIPLEDVIVVFGDTRAAPLSVTGTRSSRTAVITGGAAARAAAEVRTSVLRVAAQMLETAPENIVIEGRHLSARGAGTASVSLEDVINTGLVSRRIRAHAGEPTFSATKPFDPPGATYANGSIAVLVEVDPVSGGVELLRAVVAHDCGTVINPAIVEGQVVGAMMQGFGGALFEELSFGADGQPLSTSYLDYLLPTSSDTVSPELIHFTSPSPNTWRGVKGTAEAGTIGMTAAVVCAVANAAADAAPLIRRVPLRPSAVAALFPMPAISAPSRRSEVD
jgi:CO/xanthine dehydrogenase Mo-binding subunit